MRETGVLLVSSAIKPVSLAWELLEVLTMMMVVVVMMVMTKCWELCGKT